MQQRRAIRVSGARVGLLSLGVWLLLAVGAVAAKAPDLSLKDLAGQSHKLSALRGRAVVVSFWATWCGPCREELPRLSKLSESYKGKPVSFLAISIDEAKDRAKIAPFLQKEDIGLETWVGADTDTMARFGLGDIVPGTVILDEQGQVIVRIEGEAQEQDVRGALDWLLSGRQGAPPPAQVKRY